MIWEELVEYVDKNRSIIPNEAEIITVGHYGEKDEELWDLEFNPKQRLDIERRKGTAPCVILGGISSSYEEPD